MGRFNLNEYEMVEDRLKLFWADYPQGRIETNVVHITDDGTSVTIKAEIFTDVKEVLPISTGIAQETKGQGGPVNKDAWAENCETSAWGRCLANFGIGIDESVASANEVDIAIKKQNIKSTTKKMTIEIYQAMMKSIKDGNKDLVVEHMNKYDMTKAQKDAITKAINETA